MNRLTYVRPGGIVAFMAALLILGSVAFGAGALTNGVPVVGLSGAAGSDTFYTITVPAGQDKLKIVITGGTGDCDLYVKFGAQPSVSSYDYRPYLPGNEETVDVNSPTAGTWYIMLHGYAAYAGLTLTATYSSTISVATLTNNVPVTGLAGAATAQVYYKIDVPAGQTKLEISISGGTGDCDLYVKKDAVPTVSTYDYRPYLAGNNEDVTIDNPAAGTWYIMLRGYAAYSGLTLLAGYSGNVGTLLVNGVPVTGISGAANSETLYQIVVPAGQSSLKIAISGGTGDCDLYVKLGTPPTVSSWDYRPYLAGNEETVDVNNPAGGTWYIMLRGYQDYSGLSLVATYGDAIALQKGVAVTGLSGALNSEAFYKMDVPDGCSQLQFSISGGTGNCDLYVRLGAKPTTSSYDYRPYLSGNNETVTIPNPHSGTWYVLLEGRQAYSGVTLLGDYTIGGGVRTLSNGVPVTGLTGATGSDTLYQIAVPAGQTSLVIQISGGTGDADLYVKKDVTPTLTVWDYRPFLAGNNETVTITNPAAGNWMILIHGYDAYANLTLVATYAGPSGETGVTTLTNDVPVTGLSDATGGMKYFKIILPPAQGQLIVMMSGGTGDADLYIRLGGKPTLTTWDYRPYFVGNDEMEVINGPSAGSYYIMLYASAAYSGLTLKATYTSTPVTAINLTNGVPVTGISGAKDSVKYYQIVVPSGQDYLHINTSGGTGDVDLNVKRGSLPTFESHDYSSIGFGNTESVSVDHPAAGTWYIMLNGYVDYAGVTLVATYGLNTPAGNIFSTDPNCVALWNLEPGALTVDSRGTNTLTNTGVVSITVNRKQGAGCADFNDFTYLSIADSALSAGFPFKSTGTQRKISVTCWVKLDSLPSDNGPLGHKVIFAKDSAVSPDFIDGFTIVVSRFYDSGYHSQFAIMVDYRGNWKHYYLPYDLVTNRWYHLGVTYDNVTRAYHLRAWDDENAVMLGDATGTTDDYVTINTLPVRLGANASASRIFNGWLDEVVVFNDLLTSNQINDIRQSVYGH